MNQERFDDLTRALAGGVSRRQALKLLGGGLATGLLALVGYRPKTNSYAQASAPQAEDHTLFLPMISKVCTTPSSCGDRQYCSDDERCICVRTTEGDIRCGQIPSTCDVQLCQSSADCANLGEGYFCDAPNSGCCTDPPAHLSRCIAPCEPTCPQERVCGANCCAEGQVCTNGICSAPCPTERVCGASCCAEGEQCVNGVCTSPCAADAVTAESLQAALDALAGGATEVTVSPQGCVGYRRNFTDGVVTYEELRESDAAVLISRHSGTQTTIEQDADRDGFVESRTLIERGTTANEQRVEVNDYDPSTQQVIRRETYTRTDDTIHVVWETVDDTGELVVEAEFDTTVSQQVKVEALGGLNQYTPPAAPQAGCTAAQDQQLRDLLKEAVRQGFNCMRDKGRPEVGTKMLNYLLSRPVVINCASLPESYAEIAWWSILIGDANITITVDPGRLGGLTPEQQLNVLWHEMLHMYFGPHNPDVLKSPRQTEIDRTYACASLCFTFNPDQVTKCSCARCLKTHKCDQRCQPYKECDADMGAICPCPCRYQWYDTLLACEQGCPSGLCCFGFRCRGYNVECP